MSGQPLHGAKAKVGCQTPSVWIGYNPGGADRWEGRHRRHFEGGKYEFHQDYVRRDSVWVSERRVCWMLGQHLSTQRKVPRGADDEAALTEDIIALAEQYGRYGYSGS